MSTPIPPSPRIDYLSRLPNELLYQIFEDVYTNWNKGADRGQKTKKLIGIISKRFLDLQRQQLYRKVKITRWSGKRGFITILETVTAHPHIGKFVTSLLLEVPGIESNNGSTEPETITEAVDAFFGLLSNLQGLTLPGYILKKGNSNELFIQSQSKIATLALTAALRRSYPISVGDNWGRDNWGRRSRHSPLFESSQISRLSIQHTLPYRYRPILVHGAGSTERITLHFPPVGLQPRPGNDPADLPFTSALPSSSTVSSPSTPASPRTSIKEESRTRNSSRSFPNLRALSVASPFFQPVLDSLRHSPIESMAFEVTVDTPISSFFPLISSDSKLRQLTLDFEGERGLIGTRIHKNSSEALFSGLDLKLDFEHIIENAISDHWTIPEFSPDFVNDALILLEKASEAGLEVNASSLYKAVEVYLAYEEEKELLAERWEEWKKNGGKSKKSGKARKSKK